LLENSGSEFWLQVKDVNVFGFEDVFGLTSSLGSSLPLGNHFSLSDFTAIISQYHQSKQIAARVKD